MTQNTENNRELLPEKQKPYLLVRFLLIRFMHLVLPKSYFPGIASIIAALGLNDSVRNGKMCDPKTESGELKARIGIVLLNSEA